MLFLRELSDVHLEFLNELDDLSAARKWVKSILPPLQTDKKTVLIIAGDLAQVQRPLRLVNFLKVVQPRFKHVIYVLGNHEHYNGAFAATEDELLATLERDGELELDAITVAGNRPRTYLHQGARFICGTLWTNYLNGHERAMALAQQCLNDHRCITFSRADPRPFTPADALNAFNAAVRDVHRALENAPEPAKTVVITHHLPTMRAIHPRFTLTERDRLLNGAFASDLDDLISRYRPAYWFFGHTHVPVKEKFGGTFLVCNPVGYPGEGNVAAKKYNPTLVYEI